jgi:hypothetical protein
MYQARTTMYSLVFAEQLCSAPYGAATWAGVACTIVDLMMRIILRVDRQIPQEPRATAVR